MLHLPARASFKVAGGVVLAALMLPACYSMRPSSGGGQIRPVGGRVVTPTDVIVPSGYRVESVARGLTFPTGVAFDNDGQPIIVESGYSYGEAWTTPRLIRIAADGTEQVIATGGRNGPWTGVAYGNGAFYVAEGGELEGGRILRISPQGEITILVRDLPSFGDHHTDGPAIGRTAQSTSARALRPTRASSGWTTSCSGGSGASRSSMTLLVLT